MKIQSAEFVLSAKGSDQFRRDGRPEVAFVGRSNVGKSSLMNRLLRRKSLARTSGTPGRTQAVNYFLINDRFYFVDLPGYGFAKASRTERQAWAQLMDEYFRDAAGRHVLLCQLVDAKVGATKLDHQGYEYFRELGLDPLLVATKIDKVPPSKRIKQLKTVAHSLGFERASDLIATSTESGDGIADLWKEISAFLAHEAATTARPS